MYRIFVYVLESRCDGHFYVGITDNLSARLTRHKEGRVNSTRNRLPVSLVHYETFADRFSARKREKFLKSGDGRRVLKRFRARVVELADTPA